MAARKAIPPQVEPLGIVISNGDRNEPSPVFWSYEWYPPSADESGKKGVNS